VSGEAARPPGFICRPLDPYDVIAKQAIAGVSPPDTSEVTVMVVWPSLAATPFGRALGKLYDISPGVGVVTIGRLIALASIPIVVTLYFWKLIASFLRELPVVGSLFSFLPGGMERYCLTNRRVILQTGLKPKDEQWVDLDQFDAIAIVVEPGQEWYRAGDLVFRKGPIETFRLAGVPRPDTFRNTCLEARLGYMGVRAALAR
jgi:hypothetical protein